MADSAYIKTGESNTSSNLGDGVGIFNAKNGVDLELNSISGVGNIIVTLEGNEIHVSGTGGSGEANTASNVGGGDGIFKQKSGVDLEFNSISGVGTVSIDTVSDTIIVSGTSSGGGGAIPCFDQSFDPANIQTVGSTQDNDYLVAWVPKSNMAIEAMAFWCTNVGTDVVYLGVYDTDDTLMGSVSGVSAALSTGLNLLPLASTINVSQGQRYWLALKTIQGSMNWGRGASVSNITIAKEKFDSNESLPADTSGMFVSTVPPWVGVSGTCS